MSKKRNEKNENIKKIMGFHERKLFKVILLIIVLGMLITPIVGLILTVINK